MVLFLTFLIRIIARRIKIASAQGISFLGGVGIWFTFLIISLIALYSFKALFQVKGVISSSVTGIFVSSAIIMAFGVIDDWKELAVFPKFLVQIFAATILASFGVRTQIVYIGNLLNIIITFFWILGVTNALNHLDILDGLAATISGICAISFFVVALYSNDYSMGILCLALAGASLGFLKYNRPPAKIYMGNSGSHFLGFLLAAIALSLSYAPMGRKIALLTPVAILGLPIFDTIFLILIRSLKGRSPFRKSNDHLAFRLIADGYSKAGTLWLLSLSNMIFCIFGLVLFRAPSLFGGILLLLLVFIGVVITKKVSKVSAHG